MQQEKSVWNKILRVAGLTIGMVLIVFAGVGLYVIYYYDLGDPGNPCTQEIKLCPDGKTSVVRTGLKCEFAECLIELNDTSGGEFPIFTKKSAWGPCPPRKLCEESMILRSSGRLTLEDKEMTIPSGDLWKIVSAIKESKVFGKSCVTSPVMDYGATYYVNDGAHDKTIEFPGCEEDLRKIEKLLDLFVENLRSRRSQDSAAPSTWKTYRNEKYGFEMKYKENQPDPKIFINDISEIRYSWVAESDFEIHLFDDFKIFRNPIYNATEDEFGILIYSGVDHQWVVSSSAANSVCPLEFRTKQNVPYYSVGTGVHAGDSFDIFVTAKGLVAVAGGKYFGKDNFLRNEIVFDRPDLVLKVGCRIIKTVK